LTAPKGRHLWFALCRPFGAWPSALTPTHRSRSGLRSFVPDGTGQDNKSDSSFCGTDSYAESLAIPRDAMENPHRWWPNTQTMRQLFGRGGKFGAENSQLAPRSNESSFSTQVRNRDWSASIPFARPSVEYQVKSPALQKAIDRAPTLQLQSAGTLPLRAEAGKRIVSAGRTNRSNHSN